MRDARMTLALIAVLCAGGAATAGAQRPAALTGIALFPQEPEADSDSGGPGFGVYAGGTYNTISISTNQPFTGWTPGFAVGAYLYWKLNARWTFQPEVEYSEKGAKLPSDTVSINPFIANYTNEGPVPDGTPVSGTATAGYIEVPALFRVSANQMGGTTPFFEFGPYLAFLTGCNVSETGPGVTTKGGANGSPGTATSCRTAGGNGLTTFDYGGVAGVGTEFKALKQVFDVEGRYDLGLKNIVWNPSPGQSAKTRTFSVLLGIRW